MSNFLDNFDVIDARNNTTNVLIQDRGTLSVVNRLVSNMPYANVKEYGAIGDGLTDDRASIIAAINSGKPVFFPSGVYRVSEQIEIGSYTYLIGSGPGRSIIKFDEQTENQKYIFANYDITPTKNCFICKDLTLNVNTYAQAPKRFNGGIFLQSYNDVLIDNVEILHTSEGGNGITLWGCTAATISNCYMHDLYGDGIYVANQCRDVHVLNNTVVNGLVTSGVIDFYDSDNIVAIGNYVESTNNTTFGFNLDSIRQSIIANNNCNGSNTGIACFSISECIISGNTCRNNSFAGIELQISVDSVTPCKDVIVDGNFIKYSGQFGIVDTSTGQFNKITNNHISQSGRHGIYSVSGNFIDISGNTVYDSSTETANTYSDIYVGGTTQYPTINNNILSSASAFANIATESGVGGVMCNSNNCYLVGGTYNIDILGAASLILANNRGTDNQ